MAYYTQQDLLNIANYFHYDWFNNGFCNFYNSESNDEDLAVLKAHAKFHDIKKEVDLLISIYREGNERLYFLEDRGCSIQMEEFYDGEWLEENFGTDRLEEALESLVKKLDLSQREIIISEFDPFTNTGTETIMKDGKIISTESYKGSDTGNMTINFNKQ